MICEDCGKYTHTTYGSVPLCDDCHQKRYHTRLEEASRELKETSDFRKWKSRDMSELFWIHIGKYVKEPNQNSLNITGMAYRWACHDNHGLANSFSNAMKWANINLYTEQKKWAEKCKEMGD